jgi:hypothetical protein
LIVKRLGRQKALQEVGEAPTLLDSRPASEEGSCVDSARLPHAPYPIALDYAGVH